MHLIEKGRIDLLEIFLSVSNDVNLLDDDLNSPLFYAIKNKGFST